MVCFPNWKVNASRVGESCCVFFSFFVFLPLNPQHLEQGLVNAKLSINRCCLWELISLLRDGTAGSEQKGI